MSKSVFNLTQQNKNLDDKIVAGLERLSQAYRILLWEKAKQFGLSPIQIQLLIFILNHAQEKSTVSYLAQEFNFTKATISDAIKILEEKKLIKKIASETDTRSYTMQLTTKGKAITAETETFANPITKLFSEITSGNKQIIWEAVSNLIYQLNRQGLITVQRMCFNCSHYESKTNGHYCNLLRSKLHSSEIRIDCEEFEAA